MSAHSGNCTKRFYVKYQRSVKDEGKYSRRHCQSA